jgi:hypothetical protein
MTTIITELEIEVELRGTFTEGKQSHFNRREGQWQPPQDASLENFRVVIVGSNKLEIDITNNLDRKTINKLQEEFIEEMRSEDENKSI